MSGAAATDFVALLSVGCYAIGVLAGIVALLRGNLLVVGSARRALVHVLLWALIPLRDLVEAALGRAHVTFDPGVPEEKTYRFEVSAQASSVFFLVIATAFAVGWLLGALSRGATP